MDNPYTSPSNEFNAPQRTAPVVAASWLVMLLLSLGVIANYATATATHLDVYTIFMHTVFFTAPFAVARQIRLASSVARPIDRFVAAGCAVMSLLGFLISWTPWLSSNPYEQFAVTNWYFGPYGWMQWTWLFIVGFLPLGLLWRRMGDAALHRRLLALLVIGAYLHNAYYVWVMCHGRP